MYLDLLISPFLCFVFFFPRVLDPSGVILQIVCEPVRRYLRTRDDTVRCIVQSLIDDGSSELSEELTKGQGICLEESFEDEEDKEGVHSGIMLVLFSAYYTTSLRCKILSKYLQGINCKIDIYELNSFCTYYLVHFEIQFDKYHHLLASQ